MPKKKQFVEMCVCVFFFKYYLQLWKVFQFINSNVDEKKAHLNTNRKRLKWFCLFGKASAWYRV